MVISLYNGSASDMRVTGMNIGLTSTNCGADTFPGWLSWCMCYCAMVMFFVFADN